MSARNNILERIRKAHGRNGAAPTEAELLAVRAAIAERTRGPLPSLGRPQDPVAQFKRECDRLGTTHSEAERFDELPREVARYLEANSLEWKLVLWREFAGLRWGGVGIQFDDRAANGNDSTGLTSCFCAIAETGTLLLLSAPATPKATALLPETHIAVVRKSRIVDTMEDALALLRDEVGEPPRATWFVSGPSRTADIEQTMVIGAHGPYRAHVILIP
jgi:L-lactate dehydrogenase complex protein LldG